MLQLLFKFNLRIVMKKLVQILLLSSALVGVASADAVFVDGKAVDQKVIDQAMAQLKKKSDGCSTNG